MHVFASRSDDRTLPIAAACGIQVQILQADYTTSVGVPLACAGVASIRRVCAARVWIVGLIRCWCGRRTVHTASAPAATLAAITRRTGRCAPTITRGNLIRIKRPRWWSAHGLNTRVQRDFLAVFQDGSIEN